MVLYNCHYLFNMVCYYWNMWRAIMSIHIKNINEVINVLRDVYTYMAIQNKQDQLGDRIFTRVGRILDETDNTKQSGEANENNKRSKEN